MLPPDDPHGCFPIFKGLAVTVGLLLFLGALWGLAALMGGVR